MEKIDKVSFPGRSIIYRFVEGDWDKIWAEASQSDKLVKADKFKKLTPIG